MATTETPLSPPSPAVRQPAAAIAFVRSAIGNWPWWAQVLGIYALGRIWSALVFIMAARQQLGTGWADANPSYAEYTGLFWDADWYRRIAEVGYPPQLPMGDDGLVAQNEWAFFPLFPFTARAVMAFTSLPWQVVAPTLALLAGAAAMLVIYSLVRTSFRGSAPDKQRAALATVLLVSFFVSAPVLQVAYTEAFALLGIAGFLWLLVRRHYLAALPVAIALGFTRAIALPLVVVVVGHAYLRWRARRREPVRPTQWASLGLLAGGTFVSGFLWQILTGLAMGRADAYFATQSAWRAGRTVVPIVPWFTIGEWLFGTVGVLAVIGVLGAIVLAVCCPAARRIGPELQLYTGAYLLYLVGVIEPGTSLARFLLLAFPLATITACVSRSRAYLAVTTLSFALFQIVWVVWLWQLNTPSGWPP